MPLTPQFTWEEDVSSIALRVPLKGASRKDVDIYVADLVVKVNFKPYVLLVDLHAAVEPENTTVTITNGVVVLVAQKHERRVWKQLGFDGTKADCLARRKASMARKEAYEQKLSEARKDLKYRNEKQTLRDQMSLDELERQRLDDLKATEKQREEDAMYRTFRDLQHPPSTQSTKRRSSTPIAVEPPILEMTPEGEFDIPRRSIVVPSPPPREEEQDWGTSSDTESDDYSNNNSPILETPIENGDDDGEDEDVTQWPPPRQQVTASRIVFTPRVFPTPSRESTAVDEENWLVKNRKHLKSHKGLHAAAATAAQDISETDPVWLKAKGDDFYRHKDFRSAINAYGDALAIDPSLTPCLSNRAACFLQVGEYQLCADDCSKALALLPDIGDTPSMQTVQLKVRVLVRRGTAYCQLGLYSQAKADYGVALTIHPQNEALQLDFGRIGQLEACAVWKSKGDASYASQDFVTAKAMYTEALHVDPTFISCLSNRAACSLALLDAKACIADCSVALAILEDTLSPTMVPYSAIPAPGSAKRRLWVLKTLVRRGAAFTMEKDYAKAEQDYMDALSLDPPNAQLADDLANVRRLKRAG
ncbi:hypothetical protein H257_15525 [Aphanomyces astaci]|uniref:CS domain-containing protein n=1 Tax=Aphanomyces astaci TaxID=112090 RepID=W4FNL6_APHAT|nr:hypothetical protein H257_15525 [Aphanomyces astaci]ETV68536.1 hypothetical protein H257_15525 [Aphanomyces astaci]|eukprot:XP_009841965.1 hypothetical protein H257_15525 [Aphanomyces astaci]